jgi:hypothetical protein
MKIYHDPAYSRNRGFTPQPAALEVIWPASPRQHAHTVRATYRKLRESGLAQPVARWWLYDLLKSSVRFNLDGETWNADYDRTAALHRV